MKFKTIVIAIVGALVLAGLVWWGRTTSSQPPQRRTPTGASSLQTEESSFDFGSISMAAGTVQHSFLIRNSGTETVKIEKMYTSCMCTSAGLTLNGKRFGPYGMPGHGFIPRINQQLDPGADARVEVIFDPAAHGPAGVGPIDRQVILETDTGDPLELRISAVVTP